MTDRDAAIRQALERELECSAQGHGIGHYCPNCGGKGSYWVDALVPVVRQLVDEARPQWQPMASAPKDGTRCLIQFEPEQTPLVGRWSGGLWIACRRHYYGEALRWMPLPAPPQEQS